MTEKKVSQKKALAALKLKKVVVKKSDVVEKVRKVQSAYWPTI